MEKHGCLNATGDDANKYSSPMPIIGLYIAAGTSICLLFMICDVFHGICHRKPWIPCRFFSLNSLTLSLLAIATKLPVDLTTPMPSVLDQLSKLSGTVLICISMCFFFPSVRTQSNSERFSNMISLSIFVVTVVVNVSMQMVTGVIFLFRVEHVIIISCMLLFLAMLWLTMDYAKVGELFPISELVRVLKQGDPQTSESKGMIHRLKSFYISSCIRNPELDILTSPICTTICMLSAPCVVVLSQAALRSLVLKTVEFRCGVSDYKWSMWIIVVSQILAILVGNIAIIFRSMLVFPKQFRREMDVYEILSIFSKLYIFSMWALSTFSKLHIMSLFEISRMGFMIILQNIKKTVLMVLFIVHMIMAALTLLLYWMLKILFMYVKKMSKIFFGEGRNGTDIADMDMNQWIQRNCEDDMKRWMEKYKRNSPTNNLIQLLSRTPQYDDSFTNKVSCLSVVIFIIIATAALPNALGASLNHSLDGVFGIIYFIDKKMNTTNEDKHRLMLAKELWMNKNNGYHWFHKKLIKPLVTKLYSQYQFQPPLDLYFALWVIEELKRACEEYSFPYSLRYSENIRKGEYAVNDIKNICQMIIRQCPRQNYSSINELYAYMEQLFANTLQFFLSQLPLAIFKHLDESPDVEHEERARLVLKFLFKLEPLENKVDWSFPDGTGITSLTTTRVHHSLAEVASATSLIITQVPIINTQCIEPVEGNEDADVAPQVIDGGEIQELV